MKNDDEQYWRIILDDDEGYWTVLIYCSFIKTKHKLIFCCNFCVEYQWRTRLKTWNLCCFYLDSMLRDESVGDVNAKTEIRS